MGENEHQLIAGLPTYEFRKAGGFWRELMQKIGRLCNMVTLPSFRREN